MTNWCSNKHDAWKLATPTYFETEVEEKEDTIGDLMVEMKRLSGAILEDHEEQIVDDELVEKLKELRDASTKLFEQMADDYRYKELFEED